MKRTILIGVCAILLLSAGRVFAQCTMGGTCSRTAAAPKGDTQQKLPPENQIQLTGKVLSIDASGLALLAVGEAKLYVLARQAPREDGSVPPPPFKVGDQVQVAGVLLAMSIQPVAAETAAQGLTTVRIQVGKILCGMCSAAVQKALLAVKGVTQAQVGEDAVAAVTYGPAVTNEQTLTKAIVAARHPHAGMTFKAQVLTP